MSNNRNKRAKLNEEKLKAVNDSIAQELDKTKNLETQDIGFLDMQQPPSYGMLGGSNGGGGPMDLLSKMLNGKNANYAGDILTNIGNIIASKNESPILRLSGYIDGSKIDIEINSPLTATLASMVLEEQGKKFKPLNDDKKL